MRLPFFHIRRCFSLFDSKLLQSLTGLVRFLELYFYYSSSRHSIRFGVRIMM